MFDAVRNNKRIVQAFLALITLPFAFWGVESYMRAGGGQGDVATVGDSTITRQELGQTLREQQERVRGMAGRDFNPAMFDTPEARQAMLDSLVSQRVLLLQSSRAHLAVSDAQLREVISTIPALQENGKFSMQRYEQALRAQDLTRTAFERRLRQDMTLQQMVRSVSDTAIVSQAAAARVIAVQLEQREVADVAIRPEQFAAQVRVSAEALKDFYEKNRKQFETPERLRAEFVVLSRDSLAAQMAVGDEEVRAAYAANSTRYKQAEERRASHVLFQVAKDAPEAAQKLAREKADGVLRQLRKSPGDFARLAKELSQDPGSAANGGDLGFFGRGAMVKPFDEAVFALKENQLSEVVRSDFGFHIIKVTGIRPERTRGLDDVRAEIVAELKTQAAAKKYAEVAEAFSNMVYEQADSLNPAAEKYRLTIQQSGFFGRGDRAAAGPLGNPKLLAALFSDDAIKNRRNSEAVEVSANTLVAARVLEHKPAELRPLESVKGEIEKQLLAEGAARLAQQDGEAKLARLLKGEDAVLSWGKPQLVARQGMRGLPPEGVRAIFAAPASRLPAYAGTQIPGGPYVLFRISQVRPGVAAADDPKVKAQLAQLSQLSGNEDFNAYMAALRERFPVKVNKTLLEAKER